VVMSCIEWLTMSYIIIGDGGGEIKDTLTASNNPLAMGRHIWRRYSV